MIIRKTKKNKENDWTETWNGLYWNFIYTHRKVLENNHRMRMMTSMLDKMNRNTLQNYLENANSFLEKLDKELENEEN